MTLFKLNNQKMLYIHLIFVSLFTTFVHLTTAQFYRDCGSTAGIISDVKMSNCNSTDKVCIFKRNTNMTITIKFQALAPTEAVNVEAHGIIAGRSVPFPLPNSNGCYKSGLLCPLAEHVENTYENSLEILKSYPSISLKVKWELMNEKGADLVCLLITAKIK